MRTRIVVIGSSNTDMIIQLDRIPRPGETILGGGFTTAAGGAPWWHPGSSVSSCRVSG